MKGFFYPLDGRKQYPKLNRAAPRLYEAFGKFNDEVFKTEGALPRKQKELIALAVAHTTQCPYCIETHTQSAKREGATDKEIAEAIFIAVAIRAGGGLAHSIIAMESLDRFKK
jgi:AhpD family alkylhydroperoxidase